MAGEHAHALPNGFVFEGYRIEALLGAGGFGITYQAREIAIDRKVAIKEYFPAGLATRESDRATVRPISGGDRKDYEYGLGRFLEEAKTLVRFDHPNIVRVHRYFSDNGSGYLVMQYVEGDSLGATLRRRNTLPESEIREFLLPILDGLEQVHDTGFLHRDIKPGNIYIRADGAPVLLDFGAARQSLGDQTRSLTTVLTPGYAPIEQYTSRGKQGPGTDIYGLGATLYRAITGAPPPEALDRMEDDDMAPASAAGKGRYTGVLLQAVDAALAMSAKNRPQSVAAFKELLSEAERIAGTRPTRAGAAPAPSPDATVTPQGAPVAETPTNARPKGRSPAVRWVIAALICVVLAGVGYWGWTAYQESEQRRIAAENAKRKAAMEVERKAAREAEQRAAEKARRKDEQTCKSNRNLQAVATCTRLIESGKLSGKALAIIYLNRGMSHRRLKKYRRAIADFTQSIALNPKAAEAYYNRGRGYLSRQQYRRAIADYTEAVRLNPKATKAYLSRGFTYDRLKQYRRAIADYTQAIKLSSKYVSAYYNRGNSYLSQKRYRRAIADYTQAIRLKPSDWRPFFNRAIAYQNLGDRAKAINNYRAALRLNPSNQAARRELRALGAKP